MCGIVGYIGKNNAIPVLLNGLEKLEYRGYDSAGIAYLNTHGDLRVKKAKGKLEELKKLVDDSSLSYIGIGHTRWATHGMPSVINAHPHLSESRRIAVIHNGIIENYAKIKEWLIREGYTFHSETDTEVIAHLIDYFHVQGNSFLRSVKEAVDLMEGAYAISAISMDHPDEIIAVRKDSPLVIGLAKDGNYLASDVPALLKYTREVIYIDNDEYVLLKKDSVKTYNAFLEEIKKETTHVYWDVESAEKGGFEHFTIKEIHEQAQGLTSTIIPRLDKKNEITIDFTFDDAFLKQLDKICIVACGTAYHAGLVGKSILEELLDIPVEVDIASEFRYGKRFITDKTLFIAVSQSGETIDTLQALRKAKESGAKIYSILNVVGSSIARESDEVLYTAAGPEIGVASTKAYTTQISCFYLLALLIAKRLNKISEKRYLEYVQDLRNMPKYMQELIEKYERQIKFLADQQFNNERIFFIGRGSDYYTAMESSLKLKELSYINSFAIPAGELKHGTIALVEEGTLVVAVATEKALYEKTFSNVEEVRARGAEVILITRSDNPTSDNFKNVFVIPDCEPIFSSLLAIVPMQLFSYYVSLARGNDVDKPRNLAKSVTVE